MKNTNNLPESSENYCIKESAGDYCLKAGNVPTIPRNNNQENVHLLTFVTIIKKTYIYLPSLAFFCSFSFSFRGLPRADEILRVRPFFCV